MSGELAFREDESSEDLPDSLLDRMDPEAVGHLLDLLPEEPGRSGTAPRRLGDFRLLKPLGSGGMGIVYEAEQESVGEKRVAVKVLPDLHATKSRVERFRREISAIGRLDHPGIVPVLAAGAEEGVLYYAMKLVPGMSAATLLDRLRTRPAIPHTGREIGKLLAPLGRAESATRAGEPDPFDASYCDLVARLFLQVATALQHVHERQIVHRDVKPANLLITPDGHAVLVDFGLAAISGDHGLTRTGDFVGTMAYASPEQCRGDRVDARTDVYSAGAALYEFLTLRPPFVAAHRTQLLRRIETEPPRAPGKRVPRDLQTICLQALAKNPAHRYATAGAMADDLRHFLEGSAIEARPPGVFARLVQLLRRHPRGALAGLLVLSMGLTLRALDWLEAEAQVRTGRALFAEWRRVQVQQIERTAEWQRRALLQRQRGWLESPEVEILRAEVRGLSQELDSLYFQSRGILQRAFESIAGHAPARRALAELTAEQLRQDLREFQDLRHPDRIEALEEDLRRWDDGHRHGKLLDTRGAIELIAEAEGATAQVIQGRGSEEESSPVQLPAALALEEGSYIAIVEAPGHARIRFPFVVRRPAARTLPARQPPVRHTIWLPRVDEVAPDQVPIPAGWTLVEDEPPLFVEVESFLIDRVEVTNRRLVGWMNQLAGTPHSFPELQSDAGDVLKPRYSTGSPRLHVVRDPAGDWRVREEFDPEAPVRGLSLIEMGAYVVEAGLLERRLGQYAALPTCAQWVRAARGADARRFPWGDAFDGSVVHRLPESSDPMPARASDRGRDRSPFGVLGMVSGVAEATVDNRGPVRDSFVACGGSYLDWSPESFEILALRAHPNEPRRELGFRRVSNLIPAWLEEPLGAPAAFTDDFERADSDVVGAGWHQVGGAAPLQLGFGSLRSERSHLRDGFLVCEGGQGNFSAESSVWRRVYPGAAGLRVEARLRARIPEGAPDRGIRVSLASGFPRTLHHSVELSLFPTRGQAGLVYTPPVDEGGARRHPVAPGLFVAQPTELILQVEASQVRGELRREDGSTQDFEVPIEVHEPLCFLGLIAGNYGGTILSVDWIRVVPLEDG